MSGRGVLAVGVIHYDDKERRTQGMWHSIKTK